MRRLRKCVKRFVRSEDGPTAVEYAVMLACICGVVIGGASFLASKILALFEYDYGAVETL